MGDRQFSHLLKDNTPCLPPKLCIRILFSFSWESCDAQKKLKTKVMQSFYSGGGAGEDGGKQGVLWEMCKWRILFISKLSTAQRISDQGFCLRIQNEGEYSSKSYLSEGVICVEEFQTDFMELFCLLLPSFQMMQNFMFSHPQVGTFLCK